MPRRQRPENTVPMQIDAAQRATPLLHASRGVWVALAAALSAALHIGAFCLLGTQPKAKPAGHTPIDIEVISVAPPAVPKAPVAPVATVKPVVRSPVQRVKAPSRPTPVAAPSAAAPAPKSAVATPIHIGVSLSSTTSNGGMAVPVGNSLAGAADKATGEHSDAPAGGAASGGDVVDSFALSQAPTVDVEPDLQAYYPAAAKRDALEGQVVLQLSINASGSVVQAKVVRSAGRDFDEAAVRAATERLHFKPAQKDGRAVATVIQYTLTFLLD